MLKKIAKEFVARVVKSYKSTLIGLALGAAVIALQTVAEGLQGQNAPLAQAAAALCVLIGASLKSKALPPAAP